MTIETPFGKSKKRIRASAALSILLIITCISVYLRNVPADATDFSSQLRVWLTGDANQMKSSSAEDYSSIRQFYRTTLYENFQGPSSIDAYMNYASNPNKLQSMFMQISNSSNFLVGPATVTRIDLRSPTIPCESSNPLFSGITTFCVPPYSIQNSDSRYIHGIYDTYSIADGEVDLIYDLSEYFPPLTYRMMSIEFTVYNVNTNNVGVCRIVFERSPRGDFQTFSSATVLPPQFLYVGRSGGTALEWVVLAGHIAVALSSCVFILFFTLSKLFSRDPFSSFVLNPHYVVPIVIASLCIASFAYQISVIFSNPLITVNLGTTSSVNLQNEADTYILVNNINAINIVLMSIYFLWGHLMPRSGITNFFSILAILILWIVVVCTIISVRWPFFFDSFSATFSFVVRILLGDIDWILLDKGGFPLTVVLATMWIGVYWLTGIAIGGVISSMRKSVRKNGVVSESNLVSMLRDSIKGISDISTFASHERVTTTQLHPDLLAQLKVQSPTGDNQEKSTEANNDEEFLASIEVMADNSFEDIKEMKSDIEGSLRQVKSQLETVRWSVRETYRNIKMSSELYLDKALWEQIERLRSLMGPEETTEVGEVPPSDQPSSVVPLSSPKMSAEEEEDLEAKKARLASILNASKDQWSEFFGAYTESGEKMIDLSPISTANENLPEHVIFDHEREWYICELCDIKAASLTIMERHIGGKEHTRRLSYLTSEDVEEELPPHVVWDNTIQYYKCTLCEAKGATMEILTRHLIGKEHTRRLSYLQPEHSSEKLPDHVVWDAQSQYFVCTLCDAKAATLYIMEGHLMGTKHLKKVEYEAEVVAAKTQLPLHIEFDEPSQFYICTLCDAKAATMYLMESHLGGKEHQRRLGYGEASWGVSVAKPSSAPPEGAAEPAASVTVEKGPMPEHVIWDNIIQYYVCTLCDAKAATEFIMEGHLTGDKHKKKLANIEWYRQNAPNNSSENNTDMDDGGLPSYCVYDEKSQMYLCKWCNKKSSCSELLTNHLRGKEHAKTCSNLGIPAYGESGHLTAAKEYVDKYGFDIWARQDHWPLDTILDAGMHWKCVLCMKKFATPGSVNDHLPCVETYDQPREPVAPPPKRREIKMEHPRPAPARIHVPIQPVVEEVIYCHLCGTTWPTQDDLWFHEQKDPVHQELVKMAIGLLPKPAPVKPPVVVDPRLEHFEI